GYWPNIRKLENHLVKTALEQAKGNKAEAARILGVQRRLLYEKISEIGLRVEERHANKYIFVLYRAGIMPSTANAFQEGDAMRTRIVLVCTAVYVACIAASAGQSQDGSQDRLYSAIRANDLRQIKTLLDEGVSATAEGPAGITPLMVATETGSPEAMKMLIDRGADVNARNTYGSTALMWSVTDLKKVHLLLDHGA